MLRSATSCFAVHYVRSISEKLSIAIALVACCVVFGSQTLRAADGGLAQDQEMLIWTGYYDGRMTGELSPATITAIKAFQSSVQHQQTGQLTADERKLLIRKGKGAKESAGFAVVEDARSGV